MRRLLMLYLMLLIMSGSINAETATPPLSGDGSSGNPYQIASLGNLYWIAANPSSWSGKYFVQTADINASETQYWDISDDNSDGTLFNDPNDLTVDGTNDGWSPIGDAEGGPFTGNYDGQGYTISGLKMAPSTYYIGIGLFGYGNGAIIKNLGVTSVVINGNASSGGLLGYGSGVTISNCFSTGSVSTTSGDAGGLAGGIGSNSSVTKSYSSCLVGGSSGVGGFVGSSIGSEITFCYSTGNVNGSGTMGNYGGFVGANFMGSLIAQCFSSGDVSGYEYVAGLVAYNYDSRILNCYSRSKCTLTSDYITKYGGLVGYNTSSSLISNCYSTGLLVVAGGKGLVGMNDGSTVENSFWDVDTSTKTFSDGGTGKTTEEMKTQSTFTGWDFDTIWGIEAGINDGYPSLLPDCADGTLALTSGSNIQTVCANTAITPVVYVVGGGASGAGVVGLPEGVSGNYENETFTISGTPSDGGTYTYTVTTTGTESPCSEATATGTITVTATPPAPGITVQNNCGNSVLTATDYSGNLLWSTGETSASITVFVGATYTVTQTVEGCTSPEGSGTASPRRWPPIPWITVQNNCGNSVLTATDVYGDLLWSTGESTVSITVTVGGTYTVTQTLDGCISPEVSETAAPKTLPSAPEVSVQNNCGNSVLTATDYSGDLLWSTGASTASITVTAGGTYTVTQTVEGCTSTEGSGIAAPKTLPSAPGVSVQNNCGNSVLTATGYSGDLLWSTGASTASITVTVGGTYTVTQTDEGCISPEGLGTAAPKEIPAAPGVDVQNICGNSVLTATDVYGEVLWSTGESTVSITVTMGGTYTVTQTLEGCISPEVAETAAPMTLPSAPGVTVQNNCGNSVLTATGFSGNLLWSTGASTASITVTVGGTYTVTQTEGGCTSPEGSVAVTVPTPISGSGAVTSNYHGAQLSCATSTDGQITISASGGTGTLTYSIDGDNYGTSSVFSGLPAGEYTLSVRDANGCTFAPASITITAPPALVVSADYNSPVHVGSTLDLDGTISGGTGTYTISWTGPNGFTSDTEDPNVTSTATLTDAGTYTITVSDVNGCSNAASVEVVILKREAGIDYTGDVSVQYSDIVSLSAKFEDGSGASPTLSLAGKTITFNVGTQGPVTAVTDESGIASTTMTIIQAPSSIPIIISFAGDDVFEKCSYEDDKLEITQEDVCMNYIGQLYLNTSNTTTSTITFNLIWDISQLDNNLGDLNSSTIQVVTKYLDKSVGSSSVSFGAQQFNEDYSILTQPVTVDIGSVVPGSSMNFTLHWDVTGYYSNTCDQDAVITVAIPGNDFAAGGGYIILTDKNTTPHSPVSRTGTPGSKNNFGFNIKWAKNYSKPAGSFNTIWRQGGSVWQAKSNSAGALIVSKISDNPARYKAQITYTNVNVRQLDCDVCAPAMGNSTIIMTVYDWSDPGASGTVSRTDQIGFVVKDNKGKLLYSTNYYSTAQKDPTLVQDLAAGNIQVNSSAFKAAELTNLVSVVRDINLVTTTLKVYPNPFSDWLRFEFISPVDADARIDIFDITGRKVQTVFHKQVKAGIDYIADFKPVSNVSGMYLYRMTLGDEVFNGKVMYKR